MTVYIVFDDKGVIHQSTDEEQARADFAATEDFVGDLRLVQLLDIRR